MWLRRAYFGWLIPAAFLLPLWLFVGWMIFSAGGWAFVWMMIAIPSVFFGQLLLTLLVRARGTVRAERAVSWWDVLGFTLWNGLTVALGFFNEAWWTPVLVVTILVGLAMFWLELAQLWREAKPTRILLQTSEGIGYIPPSPPQASQTPQDVIVVAEKPPAP